VTRLDTYSIPVDSVCRAYMDAILSLPAFLAWRDAALQERWFYKDDEVDEAPVANLRAVG
jgi:glutathione S-transferase